MSQAFLNGMRSMGRAGMGDIRDSDMRSADQQSTVSGNPGLANNMRAVRPMMGAMNVPSVRARMLRPRFNTQPVAPGQQATMGVQQQVPVQGGGMPGPQFVQPQWSQQRPGMAPDQSQMPIQQQMPLQQSAPVRGFQQPMYTNQNMGRFGTNRILNQ